MNRDFMHNTNSTLITLGTCTVNVFIVSCNILEIRYLFLYIIFHLNSQTTHKMAEIRNGVNPRNSIKGISCSMYVVPPVRV